MSDARWEKVKDIFQAVLERPPRERERFLSDSCDGDESLREEVYSLLDSFEEAGDFLDESPIGEVAETIVGRQENLQAGQQFGRYKIIQKLGAGGMGEVFLAQDTQLERLVALKILSAVFSNDKDRVRRFMREARAVSALNHPNILTIHEIDETNNLRFIATEYITGETLRERQKREPLDLNEILEITAQIAAALNAAHQAGIVHRDIKPENIMLREDGLVKVLDFGLAKLVENKREDIDLKAAPKTQVSTIPGLVMGTVAYMSPEQARGNETDARTDIWSLGVCLYEMLAGVQPFTGDTASDTMAAILREEPVPLDENLPAQLQQIIKNSLQKNAVARYQTIKDFLLDLKNLKKELEFFEEFERSPVGNAKSPNGGMAHQSNGKATVKQSAISARNDVSPQISSAEYFVGEVKKHKFLSFGVLGILVAALATITYFSFFARPLHSKSINSLAVLPFDNAGGDAGSEYLSDGLSESLINKLSQLPQLKVIARSSAFKYKGKEIDPQEVAHALGVQAIVTGRVAQRGDDVQISVELINAEDKTQIWGESYSRKVADTQAIQEEIAQTVLRKLRLKLSGAQERQIATQITENPQAYQLYLNGVFYRRKNGTENLKKAIEYQNQATTLDPYFALAYTELAESYISLIAIGVINPQEGAPKARAAVEKALALDETLAEAKSIIARIKMHEFDWTGAESDFKRAIELNPNLAAAHTRYAIYLSETGRFDEALREIRQAQELDPLRTGLVGNEGAILYGARRYDEALQKFEYHAGSAADNPFAHFHLARAYIVKGRYAEAISAYQTSIKLEETTGALIYLGRAYALSGNQSEALSVLEKLKTTEKYVSPAELAVLYAALGDKEKAFATLEQAYAAKDPYLTTLKVEPSYDTLRDDPRFQDLLRRIGLLQ